MKIYQYDSYISFLRDQIEATRRPGIMTELARIAGCNRTYLSQVLGGKAHLTADHAINLAEAFYLDEEQADFFLLLLLRERSANKIARQKLERKIERVRETKLKFEPKVDPAFTKKKISEENFLRYHADWRYQAAVSLTLLPHSQTISAISAKLGVSLAEGNKLLETLSEWQLIKKRGDRYLHAGKSIEKPNAGPVLALQHAGWRAKAVDQIHRGGGLHVSSNLTLSSADALILKSKLLAFFEENRQLVYHSKPLEEAYAFGCDFFRLD